MSTLLSDQEIAGALTALKGWSREGSEMVATFKFASYLAGIVFVNEVARIAEAQNHHPDIHIGWRKVILRVSTHSAGGLTEKDVALARAINEVAPLSS